jgi:hypothetical protein
MFQQSESMIGALTGKFIIGQDNEPTKDLDEEVGLLRLCDRTPPRDLRDGKLAGLAANLQDIHSSVLAQISTGHTVEVFKAQCIELADIFRQQFQSPDDAIRAVLGQDAPGIRPGELCIPLVSELTSLHEIVGRMITQRELTGHTRDKLVSWQDDIETVLYGHLITLSPASDWLKAGLVDGEFSREAWDVLATLSKACDLQLVPPHNNPVTTSASGVLREIFFELANQLVTRWQERPAEVLSETSKTVKELSTLARGVKEGLGESAALDAEGTLSSWGGRVDSVLLDRLKGLALELERIWKPAPDSGSLVLVVNRALSELGQVRKKIEDSSRAGMAALAPILADLGPSGNVRAWLTLPQTNEVTTQLLGWRIPSSPQQVETETEFKQLKATLERFVGAGAGDERYGEFLGNEYADRFAQASLEPQKAAEHAGISLVRVLRADLQQALRKEIRLRYLAQLEDLLEGSRYRTLLAVLFWEPGQEFPPDSDVEVRDALNSLLDRKQGDLIKLQKKYRLAGDGLVIGAEVFPRQAPSEEEEEGWARVHRFLVALQNFLLGEETRSIRSAKFSFRVIPQTSSAGTVWSPSSPQDRRGHFYYPGNNSSEALQMETMGGDMGRPKVSDWGFEASRPDRRMLFVWSDLPVQAEARTDANRYFHEVRSCLAPLLLAWSGRARDESEPLEFDVTFTPVRSNLPAPMRLEFETPVPLRPPRP